MKTKIVTAPKLTRVDRLKVKIADLKSQLKVSRANHKTTMNVLRQQVGVTKRIQKLIAKW